MIAKLRKALIFLTLLLIIIFGILKIWILRQFSVIIVFVFGFLPDTFQKILELFQKAAYKEEWKDQNIGWLIYYPGYFFLHIAFIYLLFYKQKKVRNTVALGLSVFIAFIVIAWVMASYFNLPNAAQFFRVQFHNLFSLPFILLAIEGSRILYKDLIRLTNK